MKRSWVVLLLALTECSPNVKFEIAFQLPDQSKIDGEKLHVRGRKRCNFGNSDDKLPEPPVPGFEEPYMQNTPRDVITDLRREHDSLKGSFRASRCDLALTAWYDANGDNVVGKGDYVAKVPSQEIASGGKFIGCGASKNDLGIIPLRPVD